MMEMMEVAHILKRATNKSLVLLDEIGRGHQPSMDYRLHGL